MKSRRSALQPPTPRARAAAEQVAHRLGAGIAEERRRRAWTTGDLAGRARVSPSTISNVEAGRRASLDVYARLATALGLTLDAGLHTRSRHQPRRGRDVVHAAMGEYWARRFQPHRYRLAIDHPYQHYQFAGRADVLAWTLDPPALLHIENRTRFPDLQEAAGSYNAKRQYLARTVAAEHGISHFDSQTHVVAGLWSAEVLHAMRRRAASFRALCPDGLDMLSAWLHGTPPMVGSSSSFVLLDPVAPGRRAQLVGLDTTLERARPRFRGYADAADHIRAQSRSAYS